MGVRFLASQKLAGLLQNSSCTVQIIPIDLLQVWRATLKLDIVHARVYRIIIIKKRGKSDHFLDTIYRQRLI